MTPTIALLLAAVVGAVGAGTLLAFSTIVMPALNRRPPAEAIAVMQQINRAAMGPRFGVVLLAALVAGVTAVVLGVTEGEPLVLTGGVVFLVGIVGVTGTVNVPRNEWLERLGAVVDEPERRWRQFFVPWMIGNHVRAGLGVVGSALVALGALS